MSDQNISLPARLGNVACPACGQVVGRAAGRPVNLGDRSYYQCPRCLSEFASRREKSQKAVSQPQLPAREAYLSKQAPKTSRRPLQENGSTHSARQAVMDFYRRIKTRYDPPALKPDDRSAPKTTGAEDRNQEDWDQEFLTWTDEDLAGLEVFPL